MGHVVALVWVILRSFYGLMTECVLTLANNVFLKSRFYFQSPLNFLNPLLRGSP